MSVAGIVTGPFWVESARGTGRLLLKPLRPAHREDWMFAGAAALVAVAALPADEALRDAMQSRRGRTSDAVAVFGNAAGDGAWVFPGLGALAAAGWLTGSSRLERAAVRGAGNALVGSGVATTVLKFLGHRYRPRTGAPAGRWDGPSLANDNDRLSFPSGHASLAFAVAQAFASEFAGPWVPFLAYGTAALTAFARVDVNAHWTSDVLFGGALGWYAGHALAPGNADGRRSAVLAPVPGGGAGLVATASF